MIQVKYNDQKWWVLINGSWVEISEKDWEQVRIECWENTPTPGVSYWEPNLDQIYSLPNEVEFEIEEICRCEASRRNGRPMMCFNCTGKSIKVAHLKDSEPKKEYPGFPNGYTSHGNKVERSREVKKEPSEGEWSNDYSFLTDAKEYMYEFGHNTSLEEIDDLINYIKAQFWLFRKTHRAR